MRYVPSWLFVTTCEEDLFADDNKEHTTLQEESSKRHNGFSLEIAAKSAIIEVCYVSQHD